MASKTSSLVEAGLTGADLTGCRIYGVSAQCLKLEGAKQQYLVVTSYGEPEITVDNIEVAQFVYLLLQTRRFATSSTPSERKACSCWALHVTRSRASSATLCATMSGW